MDIRTIIMTVTTIVIEMVLVQVDSILDLVLVDIIEKETTVVIVALILIKLPNPETTMARVIRDQKVTTTI